MVLDVPGMCAADMGSIPYLVVQRRVDYRHRCRSVLVGYLCLTYGHCANGVHERIRTSDPRIHTTSAFAAVPPLGGRVRGLDCPFTMGVNAFRCCPSSLYTFNGFLRSLARDWHAGRPAKRSPTLSRSIASFPGATPNFT